MSIDKYLIEPELNLKNIIAESRDVAQALNEFADNLEQIEKKYAKPLKIGKKEDRNEREEDEEASEKAD